MLQFSILQKLFWWKKLGSINNMKTNINGKRTAPMKVWGNHQDFCRSYIDLHLLMVILLRWLHANNLLEKSSKKNLQKISSGKYAEKSSKKYPGIFFRENRLENLQEHIRARNHLSLKHSDLFFCVLRKRNIVMIHNLSFPGIKWSRHNMES